MPSFSLVMFSKPEPSQHSFERLDSSLTCHTGMIGKAAERVTRHPDDLLQALGVATEPVEIVRCAAGQIGRGSFQRRLGGADNVTLRAGRFAVGQYPNILAQAAERQGGRTQAFIFHHACEAAGHHGVIIPILQHKEAENERSRVT